METRFRYLHWTYYRGDAVQHWFSRRIRPAGIAIILTVIFAAFMSIGQHRNAIYQMFCFSFGLAFISLLWVIFRNAKLSAMYELPRHATVGEALRYTVTLKNLRSRRLKGARLLQTQPDARPSLEEFAQIPEPEEHSRNAFDRTMAYYRWQWLMSRKHGFISYESKDLIDLRRGETQRLALSLLPQQRGVFPMHDLRVLLPDPLGFFQKCRKVPTSPARLVVLPKRYRLPPLRMPGSAAFRIGGEETSNAIGNSGEFVGLREYRPGDSLRLIHWKSWAHTGKPMVKELEDNFYPRYALVLDTFAGSPDSTVFEEMVSVASSFIVGLDHSESLLDLMFIAEKAHTVTAGRGMERAEKLLEVLAGVKIETITRFEILSETIIRHREQMTSCLLVLNGWDEQRADFVKKLLKSGVVSVPLVIGTGPAPEGLIGYWLESGEVERDLLRLPGELSAAI
ncbi:DUF58 domain-containing protein [Luteolibacter algae]|uniref:DUF58 domain-containing protein n=1 Tax=Luteolibacter algae TaxID=454151 RepID=A0ABW5D830_9BACT